MTVLRPIEYTGIFAAALVWNPAVLVPLRYFTQGHLAGAKYLVMMALFQAGVNAIVLGLVCGIRNRNGLLLSFKNKAKPEASDG